MGYETKIRPLWEWENIKSVFENDLSLHNELGEEAFTEDIPSIEDFE